MEKDQLMLDIVKKCKECYEKMFEKHEFDVDEVWMTNLISYIKSLNLENEEEVLETYNEWSIWHDKAVEGLSPQEAFQEEMSYWENK